MNKSGIDYSNPVWTLIEKLSNKNGITEIAVNGPDEVYIEKEGQFVQLDVKITKKSIEQFVNDVSVFNNKVIDENSPLFNGSLPDGSRDNIVSPPVRIEGPAITIRKFSKSIQTFDSRKGIFGLSPDWISFLRAAIKANFNIIVSGGTGVGKTTFLNLLLQETGKHERKVIIAVSGADVRIDLHKARSAARRIRLLDDLGDLDLVLLLHQTLALVLRVVECQ